MPTVKSNYSPAKLYVNGHIETIIPALFRNVTGVTYLRERIFTPDDDFLDLDWMKTHYNSSQESSKKLVIISHGLEGNTSRSYIYGMVKAFNSKGYDVLAWNFRGCSEEMNKQLRFYHSGDTTDLDIVIEYAAINYDQIFLIGFSLGGNVTLKYLGEKKKDLNPKIKRAVTFSTPVDLKSSCLEISRPVNWLYSKRFLYSLKDKVRRKSQMMPEKLSTSHLAKIKNLYQFDDIYTAPIHGFLNADDYYTRSSAISFLSEIAIDTLLVNAVNDPFLPSKCYPNDKDVNNPNLYLEYPEKGGHCGFPQRINGILWSENRAIEFIENREV